MPVDTAKLPEWHSRRQEMARQDIYVEARAAGMLRTEAADVAGYPAIRARRPISMIETPELRRRMQRALLSRGGTLGKVAETVVDAMSANVVAVFQGAATQTTVPDHKTRVQAAKTAADLWGLGERSAGAQAGSSVTLTLAGPLAERFAEMLAPKVIDGE